MVFSTLDSKSMNDYSDVMSIAAHNMDKLVFFGQRFIVYTKSLHFPETKL